MGTMEPYGMEKDLKVLKGSSDKHRARLEGQFLGLMPAPDLKAEKEGRHVEGRSFVIRGVKDPSIRIDLKVEDLDRDSGPFREMLHLIGLDPREGDFEVISTMGKVLRALARAKFKNLAELRFNDRIVYDHPEEGWDLKRVLKKLEDLSEGEELEEAEAKVILQEEGDTEASVKVDKIHTELGHDITLKVNGEIDGEMLRRIINYLEEHLDIEELIQG
ncbi:MAG: hypothetical protein U9R75_00535 [Candidatus Thermoplasmatota archaeon]|nr:hypothetical protein [Candidatus Thermoplasmatota archaeon]